MILFANIADKLEGYLWDDYFFVDDINVIHCFNNSPLQIRNEMNCRW